MVTKKIEIFNDQGDKVQATTPVIVSASRSTDIPAYYARWFLNRLERGYCTWINPFNRKVSYISFSKTKVVVFWSKNPKPLIPYLPQIDKYGIHYYFQFTLNNYEKEKLEPNLPPLERRIETFKELSSLLGPDRVIWRFDPIFFTSTLGVEDVIKRIFHISKELKGYTNRLIISFVDIKAYRKVVSSLLKSSVFSGYSRETITEIEPQTTDIHLFASRLQKMQQYWHEHDWDLSISTCAEKINLSAYGIDHSHCIDGELISELFGSDPAVSEYLYGASHEEETGLFDLPDNLNNHKVIQIKKDKGQREECGCIVSKDIGAYDTCAHGCLYCYANSTPARAIENLRKHRAMSEGIVSYISQP